jgi:hypothetical protein
MEPDDLVADLGLEAAGKSDEEWLQQAPEAAKEAIVRAKEWDDEIGAWKYRLPDTVREALKLENVV